MSARRYTLAEIDQIRSDIQQAASYRKGRLNDDVLERSLRTLLIAGVDPDDVRADVTKAHQEATDRYLKAVAAKGIDEAIADLRMALKFGREWPDRAHDDAR